MRVPRLTENEIAEHLVSVPEWARVGEAISRTYSFKSFRAAITFVAQVAEAAEDADHHPEIDIRHRKVTLSLTTHDVDGLTVNDFALASVCDSLANGAPR